MIDAIIALIRGAADVETARAGPHGRRRSSSPRSRPTTSSTCSSAASPSSRARSCATSSTELQATIKELESILDERGASSRAVIKDELAEVRDKYADERRTELTIDTGDLDVLDLIEDEEVVVVLVEQGLHQDRRGRRVPPAGSRRARRARRQPARRGLRRAPAHHHRALVPAVLLEPRPCVPAPRARDPDEGAHRARHRDRQPHPAREPTSGSRRHRHPHLRGRRVPVLRDPEGHGEEDAR